MVDTLSYNLCSTTGEKTLQYITSGIGHIIDALLQLKDPEMFEGLKTYPCIKYIKYK